MPRWPGLWCPHDNVTGLGTDLRQPSRTHCCCPPRWGRRVTPGGGSGGKKSPCKTVTERLICLKFPARLPGGGVCQPGRPLQSSAVRVSPPWRDPHPASRPSGGCRAALGQGQAQGSAERGPEPGSADLPRSDMKCHRFRAGQMPSPRPYSESLGRNKVFQAQILAQALTQRQNKVRTGVLMGVNQQHLPFVINSARIKPLSGETGTEARGEHQTSTE